MILNFLFSWKVHICDFNLISIVGIHKHTLFTVHYSWYTLFTLHTLRIFSYSLRHILWLWLWHILPGWRWWYYQLNPSLSLLMNRKLNARHRNMYDFRFHINTIRIRIRIKLMNDIHLARNELCKFTLFKRMKRNFIVVWICFVDFLFFKANQTNERIF